MTRVIPGVGTRITNYYGPEKEEKLINNNVNILFMNLNLSSKYEN